MLREQPLVSRPGGRRPVRLDPSSRARGHEGHARSVAPRGRGDGADTDQWERKIGPVVTGSGLPPRRGTRWTATRIAPISLENPASETGSQLFVNHPVHEPAHQMNPQTAPAPLARQPSEIHPGWKAPWRIAAVFEFDPQRPGPREIAQPNRMTRFAAVRMFDDVGHRLSDRNRDLLRGSGIETFGDRHPPRRLVHHAQALAGCRNVDLERRPSPVRQLSSLQS